ncbi:MAG: hypothetical protein U1E66_10325 [Rhodospirillales bacterium]
MTEPNSEEAVRRLVYDWFEKITDHAPFDEIVSHFIDNSPEMRMRFPDQDVANIEEFRQWYTNVINRYFDQAHVVKSLRIQREENIALLDVQVEWSAKYWQPPEPRSSRVRMDAFQRWVVRHNPETGKWGIKTYLVDNLFNVADVGQ